MQRSWRKWLGLGLAAPALALGCRSRESTPPPPGPAFTPPMIGAMAPAARPADHHLAVMPPVAATGIQPVAVFERTNSQDFSALVGVLSYNPMHNTWRLHYAPAGADDRFGGSVTLEGANPSLYGYASGQVVRVEGELANPTTTELSPAYRARGIALVSVGR